VLVSHDARLIAEVECDLYVCDAQNVTKFPGDLDDYREMLLRELEEQEARISGGGKKKAAAEVVEEKPKKSTGPSIFDLM